MENKIKLEEVLTNLKTNESNFYFFVLDTRGNPTAGVANIYEHVKQLTELGFKAHILHEKNDYKLKSDAEGMGIEEWLGEEYAQLSHISIEAQQLSVKPSDFIVIPEVFSNIMDQVKTFPCKKIVMCQTPEYMFELLGINKRWDIDYGFKDVITVSETVSNYVKSHFPNIKTHEVPISIPNYFKPSEKPKIPIVSILCRNSSDTVKIIKSFYLQHPLYKWVTFRELKGLTRKQFAEELGKSFLSVWVDDLSGFGTFPLESMKSNTTIIGKLPNILPEWLEDADASGNITIKENGVWVSSTKEIPTLVGQFIKLWLEDGIPEDISVKANETALKYTEEAQNEKLKSVYSSLVDDRVKEIETLIKQTENA